MGSFTDPRTGRTWILPDGLDRAQQRVLIQQLLSSARPVPPEISQARKTRERLSVEDQLGAPVRTSEAGEPVEFDEPGVRFDLGRSNLLSERLSKLQDKLPDHTIRQVKGPEGEPQIFIKAPDDEEFTPLDSRDVTTLSDFADVGGVLASPETLANIAVAVKTRGAPLFKRMFAQAAAGSLGRGLDNLIEAGRGFQDDPLDDLFQESVVAGAFSMGGEAAFAGARRVGRAAGGSGAMDLTEQELKAIATAKEAKIRNLSPGQVHPLARTVEQQAASTSKPVAERRVGQLEDALLDLKRVRDSFGDAASLTDDVLEDVATRAEAAIYKMVTFVGRTSPEKAGRALKAGRKEFTKVWKKFVGRRYDKASGLADDVSFDISEVQALVRDILKGVRAKGAAKEADAVTTTRTEVVTKDGEPFSTKDVTATRTKGAAQNILEKIEVTTPVKGKQTIKEVAEVAAREADEGAVQLRQLSPELRTKMQEILELDPDIRMFEGNTAFEQIKELRSSLFDLKNATVQGAEDINNRFAGQVWSSLTKTMGEPTGGSVEFVRALKSANAANARFERLLEVQDLKRIATETQPDRLAVHIAKPMNGFVLRTLKRIIPPENWQKFVDGFKTDLMRDKDLLGRLEAFARDPQALRLLLSEAEEVAFKRFGREMNRFNSGPVKQLLESQTAIAERSKHLINSGSADDLAGIIERQGGKGSSAGRSLQAGLVQVILDEATIVKAGREVLSPESYVAAVKRLEQNGVLDAVLEPAQKAALKDRQMMQSFFTQATDPGASIQAAQLGADVGSVLTVPVQPVKGGKKFLSGVIGVSRNALIGRLLTSNLGRRFFMGVGRATKQPDLTTLRALAVIGSQVAARMELAGKNQQDRSN